MMTGCLILSINIFAQSGKIDDGVHDEITSISKKSSTNIDESYGFKVRGLINYSVPLDLNDRIEVADANNQNVNVKLLMNAVNRIEQDNEIYKAKLDSGIPKNKLRKEGCIDSYLLFKNGKLILEEYFGFASIDNPHYQMSITKSVASFALGIAIDKGFIESENDLILKHIPEVDSSKLSDNTKSIKIKDVLSMKSGIQLDKEFLNGVDEKDFINQSLLKSNTLVPGTIFKYQGINPEIIVQILWNTTGKNMVDFVDEYLYNPLGIKNYSFDTSPNGLTKAAAGMKLRSRDMLKLGILSLNKGKFNGKQIINENWVEKANGKYVDNGKNKYGYFWWTHYISYNNVSYEVNSCRGALGQFIFCIPELKTVAVFTSNGTRRPFEILENIVIPSVVN